jgi:16S rRNA (cytosine1402-N4)-methyltransferase
MSNHKKEDGYHRPVLLQASIDNLNIQPNGVYVDVTFGGGGHSKEILKYLEKGRLIAFDQDPEALANRIDDPRFELVDQNFRFMKNWLRLMGIRQVDGILADLGVSSHQFDSEERGFSIRFDATLDMRMDMKGTLTAADVVNSYEEQQLTQVLRSYGELENARSITRSIMQARPLFTSDDLKHAVQKHLPRMREHKVLAQLFQALRIEVNKEMEVLEAFLQDATDSLKPGGRLVVISYHSLEDRLVKNYIRAGNASGEPDRDVFGKAEIPLKAITKKPVEADAEELKINPRSRSARMRVAVKV